MMLTKTSPENLVVGKRYRYQLADGEVWHGIFRGLDSEGGRLVLEFRQFGKIQRVKWSEFQGIVGEA